MAINEILDFFDQLGIVPDELLDDYTPETYAKKFTNSLAKTNNIFYATQTNYQD